MVYIKKFVIDYFMFIYVQMIVSLMQCHAFLAFETSFGPQNLEGV